MGETSKSQPNMEHQSEFTQVNNKVQTGHIKYEESLGEVPIFLEDNTDFLRTDKPVAVEEMQEPDLQEEVALYKERNRLLRKSLTPKASTPFEIAFKVSEHTRSFNAVTDKQITPTKSKTKDNTALVDNIDPRRARAPESELNQDVGFQSELELSRYYSQTMHVKKESAYDLTDQ